MAALPLKNSRSLATLGTYKILAMMNHVVKILVSFCLIFSSELVAQNTSISHIKANVPGDWVQFDKIMKRDLSEYFIKLLNTNVIEVEYELLRNSPTQSGMAYPKFYAWVKVRIDVSVVREGVVRVAIVERKYIEVTHFFSKKEIGKNHGIIKGVFPKLIEGSIFVRVGE